MTDLFDLTTSEWIPVISAGRNSRGKVGLMQLFQDADRWCAIHAPTPIETAALFRFLFAIIHSAIDVNEDNWVSMWKSKRFPLAVSDYLSGNAINFRLFDPARPFYQDATLNTKPESVSSLLGYLASGNNATIFNHTTEQNGVTMQADQAVLALLAAQTFGLSGTKGSTKSFADGTSARGVSLFIEGNTLFETLMLNVYDRSFDANSVERPDKNEDKPCWAMDDPYHANMRRPYGLLDHLTWLNRRVKLLPDPLSGKVSMMMYDVGLRTSNAANEKSIREVFNPFYFWQANTKRSTKKDVKSHSPLRFVSEKALWRDSATLFRMAQAEVHADKSPTAFRWVGEMANTGFLDWAHVYRCVALGACTEPGQSKTFFYRTEVLPLPLSLLNVASGNIERVTNAVRRSNDVRNVLQQAFIVLARFILKPMTAIDKDLAKVKDEEHKPIIALVNSWGVERQYWSRLEAHFHQFVQDVPGQPEVAMNEWLNAVRNAARAAFDQAANYAAGDRRSLRAHALAAQLFHIGLARVLGRAPDETPEEQQDIASVDPAELQDDEEEPRDEIDEQGDDDE